MLLLSQSAYSLLMNAASVHPTGYRPRKPPPTRFASEGAERFNKGKPVPEGGLFEIVRLGGTFDSPLSLPEKDRIKMNNPPGKYPDVTERIQ